MALRSPPIRTLDSYKTLHWNTCDLRETCLAKRFGEIDDHSTYGRSMVLKSARTPNARSSDPSRRATSGGGPWPHERQHCRDDGARALRAVFSSHDNWLNLSEAERDEWRGYFDRMLGWLQQFGYTPERNPCSTLLEAPTDGSNSSNEEAP